VNDNVCAIIPRAQSLINTFAPLVDELLGSKFARPRFFLLRRRHDGHAPVHSARELRGHLSESAQSENCNFVVWLHSGVV
jgi:hypothetical protein